MTLFELTILGSNSAMPAYGRWPTSQVLRLHNESILIDCGEGAQIRMNQYKIKKSIINTVLISHLHGDHIYGLPGFIGSLSHLSRKRPLKIYGPNGIKEYIETTLRLSQSHLAFELDIEELEHEGPTVVLQDSFKKITCFPVNHRIPTYGYLIEELPRPKNILKEKIAELSLSVEEILAIKAGGDLEREGMHIANDELTHPNQKARSYAYCADTQVSGWSNQHLIGVDLMYFETTYLDELAELAIDRGHATAKQAAQFAKELKVGQLVIGHYSSRYRIIDALWEEAKAVFPCTVKGYDGLILNI